MKEIIKTAAEAHFPLIRQNIGSFSELKGRGMRFWTEVYEAEGIGRLCLMEMKAFAGLMRMTTGVFSPVGLDGPILSFDYIKVFGKETFLVEFYDTTLSHPSFARLEEVKRRYERIPSYDPGEHWYDRLLLPFSAYKRGKNITNDLSQMLKEYCGVYFLLLESCDPCDPEAKKKCNQELADGLMQNGGPAVDTFRKMIGDEQTERFLKNCMFYC